MASKERPDRYWYDYDNCYSFARNFETRTQIARASSKAWESMKKHGWFKDYYWLKSKRDIAEEEFLKKCKEIHGEYGDDYSKVKYVNVSTKVCIVVDGEDMWFRPKEYLIWKRVCRKTEWTEESAISLSKNGRYKTWHDFGRDMVYGGKNAYEFLRKKHLLHKITWLGKPIHDSTDYVIYAYIDYDNMMAYIGLTVDMHRRDLEHRRGIIHKGVRKYDSVWKHFNSINKEIPNYVVKMDGLTAEQASFIEDWYIEAYKKNGWKAINIAKGGSLGMGYKYTDEYIAEVASNYRTKTDFRKGNPRVYEAAYKRKLLDSFVWEEGETKPRGYWNNYDRCYEVAKQCSCASEMGRLNGSAYNVASQNGWVKTYTWFKRPGPYNKKWNYDTCKEEAKKYKSRGEFSEKNGSAYAVCSKNKWLDEFFPKPK